ncbi:MAG: ATP-binding cassette domain-containing protein [Candidatus Accumulibacter sp.]|jgi:ATP-binding cassette subfamily F protein uup|nr:ATP-binding cassette domain-containing protein [Accumulibacter sp.]
MPCLTLTDASLAYGHLPLLDHADFQLDAGERVALIGRNGAGKSSLLRVLAGYDVLDDGRLWIQPGFQPAHLSQEPAFDPAASVFDAVAAGMGEISDLLAEYHVVSHALSERDSPEQDALFERLHVLQGELELCDAWSRERRIEELILRFSLDADARVEALSGGQKKRLALAQALATDPRALLLDEPTNHLDIACIEWLEEMLISSKLTLVFVTHDRRFLDRVATRIVELDRGALASFPAPFAVFERRKEEFFHDEAVRNAKFDKFLAQEEVWIRKGVEARRTRDEGRVRRLERLRRERAARRERVGAVGLRLERGDAGGQLVVELDAVSKSFGDRKVVRDFSCRLLRGDKIGLIGPNGAGKTTLLKLIVGELSADSGSVRRGSRLKIAYFDQFRTELDDDAMLVDVISPGSDFVEIGGVKKHVVGYLGDFLFPPQRARSQVKSLSGGERNRLLLARLFAKPANVLVLDEPTNDLDIETLELLERLLQDYTGTLFLVSHDRAFLDNVVTQTIAAEGGGFWREYVGGHQDWADRREKGALDAEKTAPARVKSARVAPRRPRERKGLSTSESRELAELPDRIARLEDEQKTIALRLADPALYTSQPQEARTLSLRLARIDDELTALMERWELLETEGRGQSHRLG